MRIDWFFEGNLKEAISEDEWRVSAILDSIRATKYDSTDDERCDEKTEIKTRRENGRLKRE